MFTFALENRVVKMKANMIIERPNSKVRKKIRKKCPLSKTIPVMTAAAITAITRTMMEYTANQESLKKYEVASFVNFNFF